MTAEEIVRIELDADPLDRGYDTMSDVQVDADLHELYCETWDLVSASDILEAIVPAAWQALTADERADVDSVLSMGTAIDFSPGSRARVLVTTAFAGSAPTLNNLLVLGRRMISRAEEIGCGVAVFIVIAARALT